MEMRVRSLGTVASRPRAVAFRAEASTSARCDARSRKAMGQHGRQGRRGRELGVATRAGLEADGNLFYERGEGEENTDRPKRAQEIVEVEAERTAAEEKEQETDLIFRLERHGEGWGEAVFPFLSVEQRPIQSSQAKSSVLADAAGDSKCGGHKRRGQTSGNSRYIQLEEALLEMELTEDQVNDVISVAVAWRVTEGGHILVDRRRRAKALKNVRTLVPYLENLGVPRGKSGVGDLVSRVPLLILCNVDGADNWDKRAVQLAAHWFRHGKFDPSEASGDLKRWTHRVRRHKAEGKLSQDQVKLLELIGFDFGLGITSEWEGMFDRLLDFILETGHSHPMPSYESESGRTHVSLHEWTELQRIAYAAGRLAPCHVERLESIQFDWSAKYVSRWLRYYQDYRALRAEKGTLKVQQQPGELDDLGGRRFWRQKQQVLWYTKHIWPERQTMLQEISFELDPYSTKFREVCGVVEALQQHYGVDSMLALLARLYDDLMVPSTHHAVRVEPIQVRQLARWLKIQLVLRECGAIAEGSDKKARLDRLGVQWEGLEWQMNFEGLLKFRAVSGHCDVPKDHRLSPWVVNMRQNRHDLPYEYKSLLDMVGFTWERRGAWSRMFNQLTEYREENGHVAIPREGNDQIHNHLGAWLTNQRALWRKGKLTGQQVARLEAIGVTK